jgi:hypothetical protein
MNPERTADQIRDRLSGVSELYNRLLLVVGPPGSGKTSGLLAFSNQDKCPVVNVGVELSRRLLELTERQRIIELPSLLAESLQIARQRIWVRLGYRLLPEWVDNFRVADGWELTAYLPIIKR